MAKKNNTQDDTPQKNAGAATTTEQPNATVQKPDEIAGAATGTTPCATDHQGTGSQADENAAGATAGAAGETEHPNPARAASDAAEEIAKEATTKAKTKKAAEPKVSDVVAEIGKSLLKNNPEMSVVYMTADGRGFYEKNDAELHARTLNNKAVTPVNK